MTTLKTWTAVVLKPITTEPNEQLRTMVDVTEGKDVDAAASALLLDLARQYGGSPDDFKVLVMFEGRHDQPQPIYGFELVLPRKRAS